MRLTIGQRTLLAANCRKCGKFMQGKVFGRHRRNMRDHFPYLDLRCTNCKWGAKLKGPLL